MACPYRARRGRAAPDARWTSLLNPFLYFDLVRLPASFLTSTVPPQSTLLSPRRSSARRTTPYASSSRTPTALRSPSPIIPYTSSATTVSHTSEVLEGPAPLLIGVETLLKTLTGLRRVGELGREAVLLDDNGIPVDAVVGPPTIISNPVKVVREGGSKSSSSGGSSKTTADVRDASPTNLAGKRYPGEPVLTFRHPITGKSAEAYIRRHGWKMLVDGDGNCAYAAWAEGMLALLAVKGASGFGVRVGLDSFLGTPAGRASLSGMKQEEFDQKRASIMVPPALMATNPLPATYWYSDLLTGEVAEKSGVPCAVFSVTGVPCAVFSVTGDSFTCVPRYIKEEDRRKPPRAAIAIISNGSNHFDRFVLLPDESLPPVRVSHWAEKEQAGILKSETHAWLHKNYKVESRPGAEVGKGETCACRTQ